MSLISELDGIVFSAFQQNFLSNYAEQTSPETHYSLTPDVDPPFEPTDTSITQGAITYQRFSDSRDSPTQQVGRHGIERFPSPPLNINSPTAQSEKQETISRLPFQNPINAPSNNLPRTFPSPPGSPPQNLGVTTSPWPPNGNPSKLSQAPRLLPRGDGQNLYDGGPLSLTKGGPFSTPGLPASLRPVDAFTTAHWLRNIGKELFGGINFQDGVTNALISTGTSKGFQFVSSQILLASLNPKDPELGGVLNATWNPSSLIASTLPLTRPNPITSLTAGPVFGQTFDAETSRIDKYIEQTKALSSLEKNPEDFLGKGKPSKLPSLFGGKGFTGFDIVKETSAAKGIKRPKDTPQTLHARIVESYDGDIDGITESGFEPDENKIYMPLVFQDLRDKVETFLYFRAFIKPDSVTETFTPRWNETSYYGRVDNVPIYMGTTRMINFAFDVVAWQPADLPIVYRKLHKLQSMVYPFFDQSGFLSSGPIIRMRMGDLFSTTNNGKRGLPGYLNSLDLTFDNVWNIEKDFKIPRKATVSISFTALHEGNPGIYPTNEQGKELPTFGIGIQNDDSFNGVEVGIRGLLENVKRERAAKSKPATAAGTLPTIFEVDSGAGSAL